ncbi:hypothetical protein [Mesorhizobium sp. M0910]|uniref:hypothetical protein n=1 Tax=Mesorhizobium sp. M0910 TaxID=2957025 RepID=UPI00333CABAA
MAGRQRFIDEDQKLEPLQRTQAGEPVSKLADEVGISRHAFTGGSITSGFVVSEVTSSRSAGQIDSG